MEPLSKITGEFLSQIQKDQERIFEYALRNVAIPPIKGEITKSKIRWRGIRIINKNNFGQSETWLEQRGIRISEIIIIHNINQL